MFSQRRIELGLTQDYVANYVGVKVRTFQNWEANGYPGPLPLWKIRLLCDLYKWTFEQLLKACYPDFNPADRGELREFMASEGFGGPYKTNGGMA